MRDLNLRITNRLKRGDDVEGIAEVFGVDVEYVKSLAPKKAPKKKAAKKKQ